MSVDPYANCPCGSGKKHKWCCAPYFERIQRAFELQQQGQHEGAVREFEALTAEFPDRPQIWGFYANLLFGEDKTEQAENALARAFAIDPQFPMGFLLQGILRQQEGEVIGSLLLFRKAAEAYPDEAHDQLAQVYEMIARNEVLLNRPVAARAALERATHLTPGDAELREQFDGIFGADSRLPEAAHKAYKFRATVQPIAAAPTGKISAAKSAFESLVAQVPDDPAAWFNLGVCRAWLGEQPSAVEALETSLEKEWDDDKAEETAALLEVLRCGQGMEADTDYLEHRMFMPVRDPEVVFKLLQTLSQEGQILAPQMDPNGQFFTCLVAEPLPALVDTGTTMARARANLSIAAGVLRLWHRDGESVRTVGRMIRDRVNLAVGEPTEGTGVAQFQDILQEALAFPVRTGDLAAAEAKLRDYATQFFEEKWAQRPLKSLAGAAPIDAAGSSLLRKRLLGVVKFLADCLRASSPRRQTANGGTEPVDVYDFNRLRHKLGCEKRPPGAAPDIAVPKPAPAKVDFTAMNAADLAAVDLTGLSVAAAEEAMRAALKLDARDLAVRFAQAGTKHAADPSRPDRYPLFACAVTGAVAEGNVTHALELLAAGEADDQTANDGKRAAEYGLQKARLLARSGRAEEAAAAFTALADRFPNEPKFLVTAAEAMLSAKQPARALAFAERGQAAAKTRSDRDLSEACRELAEAARRMTP